MYKRGEWKWKVIKKYLVSPQIWQYERVIKMTNKDKLITKAIINFRFSLR